MTRTSWLVLLAVIMFGAGLYFYVNRPGEPVTAGVALAQVKVPQLTAAELAGKAKFDQFCAACHGANAAGQDGVAPPLVHKIYEPGHHADGAFYLAVMNGVRAHHWPFGNMPPVAGVTQDDVSQIITYVRALQRANGIN